MQLHNRSGTQKRDTDGWPASPELPALDLLSDHLRQRIMWALAHEPRTPTTLAHALGASQPLISKHLAILRAAGLVEAHRDPHDRRARVYDIRRDQLILLRAWIDTLQRNWRRRHTGPADADSYKARRLDPNYTTRGTPRQRIPRALKEPWER
jgi:DNA-binding MarR family transcriptional regulator